jgi:hypothetical protein
MLENGDWKIQTTEQKKIVALTQQIKTLQNNHKPAPKEKKVKSEGSGDDGSGKGKTPWYFLGSNDGDPNTVEKNGKTYHWCLNHGEKGKWAIHKPADCNASNRVKTPTLATRRAMANSK